VIPTNIEEKARPKNTQKRHRQNLTQPARSTALIEGPDTVHENAVTKPVLVNAEDLFPDGEAGLLVLPQDPVMRYEEAEVKGAEREGAAACKSREYLVVGAQAIQDQKAVKSDDAAVDMEGKSVTPAGSHLFEVNEKPIPLDHENQAQVFHFYVAKSTIGHPNTNHIPDIWAECLLVLG
jgi:hypothetical protein